MSNLVKLFRLTVTNRKKKKPNTPFREISCVGVLFTETKHVVLDTDELSPLYKNYDEMLARLKWWGDVFVEWVGEEVNA